MRFVSVLFFLVFGPVAAQEIEDAKLVSDPFLEAYQPDVSVSGSVIVGVMTASVAAAVDADDITVRRASGAGSNEVCLRVASRDGVYMSKNTYALPESDASVVRLPYEESTMEHVVEGYGPDEVAVSATVGACDTGNTGYLLLSSGDEAGAGKVMIYLNSFGATDVFFQLDDDPKPCEYISKGKRTAYDFVCRLTDVDVSREVAVSIIRERFGRQQPGVMLTIMGSAE